MSGIKSDEIEKQKWETIWIEDMIQACFTNENKYTTTKLDVLLPVGTLAKYTSNFLHR